METTKYFEAKKMTPQQVNVFMEERKWDYRGNLKTLHCHFYGTQEFS